LKLLAVAGNPILHSRSPELFSGLFGRTGVDGAYFRMLARDAGEAAAMARGMRLDGFNVTSPFKVDLIPFLDEVEGPALEAGAVNCVYRRNGHLIGANTDHIGVVRALRARGVFPEGRRAVVLGAGGAARAAAYGLVKAGAAKVTVVCRTIEKARQVDWGPTVEVLAVPDSERALKECDICLSCVPEPGLLPGKESLKEGCLFMSASYKKALSRAGGKGPELADGRDWLLHQAGPSFRILAGTEPPESFPDPGAWDTVSSAPVRKSNVALIGFSGTGKTASGQDLAALMGYRFVDTDALIETRSGMSIPALFRRGEPAFRDLEREVVGASVPAARRTVFATGGGAVLDGESAELLRRHCLVVWLWASAGVAVARIDRNSRPLLGGENAAAKAGDLLEDRIPRYARIADLALSSERASAAAVAKRIKDEMDQAFDN
jgi:shikimate dehydrogenase